MVPFRWRRWLNRLSRWLPDVPPRAGVARARPRRAGDLAVEELERRTLPSTLAQLTPSISALPASDSTGGASQARTSADGNFIVYTSTAANVVPGQVDTAVASNVFLYDRQNHTTTLVSHVPGSPIIGADGNSLDPRISSDGHFVVYESAASDLVAGQAGPRGYFNVFLYNLLNNANTLVSHRFSSPTTSADDNSETASTTGFGFGPNTGRFLLFTSNANDLVSGEQGPDVANLFLYDTNDGTNTLVSHNADPTHRIGGDGDTGEADLTPDGSTVVYESFSTDVIPQQTGNTGNIFRYDRGTGDNQLVSGVFAAGSGNSPTVGAGSSLDPSVSADGSTIAYVSSAGDLVAGQATSGGAAGRNVFLSGPSAGTTALVSGAGGSASVTANADSPDAVLSSDGTTVAFLSGATNLVSGQGGNTGNVFLYHTSGGTLTLASHVANQSTAAGGVSLNDPNPFEDLSLSADGSLVAYLSTAGDLVTGQSGTAGVENAFLYQAGQNTLASHVNGSSTVGGDQDTASAQVSSNGSAAAFLSFATTLVPGVNIADGGQNLYVLDLAAGTGPTLASRSAFPATATTLVYGTSADGSEVLFTSNAPNVVPNQVDNNHDQDLFLLDRDTGTITLVSHVPGSATTTGDHGSPSGTTGVQTQNTPVISADGNWVVFVSTATDLVTGESGESAHQNLQVFLFDNRPGPTHGTVTLVSHDFGSLTAVGTDDSDSPVVSKDGHYVAFRSLAPDLVEGFVPPASGLDTANVFLYDTTNGTTRLVSQAAGPSLTSGDKGSGSPSLSDDGGFVAYQSLADDLVAGSTVAPVSNVYLFDRTTGKNTLVSHAVSPPTTSPTASSTSPVISHDGSTVAFVSFATDLVPLQQPTPFTNVFLYRVAGGAITLVSGMDGSATSPASSYSDSPALSDNGSAVAFRSDAPDLVVGQVNTPGSTTGVFLFGSSNVFLFQQPTAGQPTPTVTLLSHAADSPLTTAAGDSTVPAIDGAGDLVVYLSTANDLVPNQEGGGVNNVFVYSANLTANALVSGQDGSPSVAGVNPSFLALVSRDPVVAFNVLSGRAGASAPFVNTLVKLVLSSNTVADGSGPGTVVGTLSVDSPFAGHFRPPTYGLLAGVYDNGSFALGGSTGVVPLVTEFPASLAGRQSYEVGVNYDIGLGNATGLLSVAVVPDSPGDGGPPPPPPTRGVKARLVSVRVGRKKKLKVRVFYADTGAEKEEFLSPFQPPACKNVQVSVGPGNVILVTARKGKRPVSQPIQG